MAPRPRVGYLGPQGTFSEEALLASACEDVEPVPEVSIYETVAALRRQEVDWAIVPIENSLEGSINVTLDLLAEDGSDVQIVGETLLRVTHSLIAARRLELSEIKTVITHPQVPGQCARLLRGELAHAQVLPASSTAEAVRAVARDGRADEAALGTVLAARLYGATVLREGVEDRADNQTRFVWLGRAGDEAGESPIAQAAAAGHRTSLVFWGPGADSAGWLVRCLDEFATRGINLTKIESRPRRERLGSYMFFADLEGRLEDPPIAEALAGVRSLCQEARVLGSYRSAPPVAPPV